MDENLKVLIIVSNAILLNTSVVCFSSGEMLQGSAFLAVMWVGSVAIRIRKEDEG